MISLLLLIAAVVLAVWAALVPDYITYGSYGTLLALSLACGFASFLPWVQRRP